MNWEALGAIGEVVGAAGVIVSLLYLAGQVRSNSRLLRHTARRAPAPRTPSRRGGPA